MCFHQKIEGNNTIEEPCPANLIPWPKEKDVTNEDIIRILSSAGVPNLERKTKKQQKDLFTNFKEGNWVQNYQAEHPESYIATCPFTKIEMMLKIRFANEGHMLDGLNNFLIEKEIEIESESDNHNEKRAFLSFLLNYESRLQNPRIREQSVVDDPYILIPCILHLTSRTGEKLWRLLINECLLKMPHLTDGQKQERIGSINEYVANRILNTGEIPASDIVIKVEKGKLDSFSISSNRLRKTIAQMQEIINLIYVTEEDRSERLVGCPTYDNIVGLFQKYNDMMSIFKIPVDQVLNIERIYEFQDYCDSFAEQFIKLFDSTHITNYFHMLFAGLITDMILIHGDINH